MASDRTSRRAVFMAAYIMACIMNPCGLHCREDMPEHDHSLAVELEHLGGSSGIYKRQACTAEIDFIPDATLSTNGRLNIYIRNIPGHDNISLRGICQFPSDNGELHIEPSYEDMDRAPTSGHPGKIRSIQVSIPDVELQNRSIRLVSCQTLGKRIDRLVHLGNDNKARINLGFTNPEILLPFDREWLYCSETDDAPSYLYRLYELEAHAGGQFALLQYCWGTEWHETASNPIAILHRIEDRLYIVPILQTVPAMLWDATSVDDIRLDLHGSEEMLICDFSIPNIQDLMQAMEVPDFFNQSFETLSWVNNHYAKGSMTPVLEALSKDGPTFTFVAGIGDTTGYGPFGMPTFSNKVPRQRRMRLALVRDISTGETYYRNDRLLGCNGICIPYTDTDMMSK